MNLSIKGRDQGAERGRKKKKKKEQNGEEEKLRLRSKQLDREKLGSFSSDWGGMKIKKKEGNDRYRFKV